MWFVIFLIILTILLVRFIISLGKRAQHNPQPSPAGANAQRDEVSPQPSRGTTDQAWLGRGDYMSPEDEERFLTLDEMGKPTATLRVIGDRMVLVTDGGIVNPRSTRLRALGLYSFTVHGTDHYAEAVLAADLLPGSGLRLVREPTNKFDSNAIALHPFVGKGKIGYVNKQNAKRLAPLLDSGRDLICISTRGDEPKHHSPSTPAAFIADAAVIDHLQRLGK